jgi:hypothetical protein
MKSRYDRFSIWNAFLNQYKLVGMTKQKIRDLLGVGEPAEEQRIEKFYLVYGLSVAMTDWVEIEFKEKQVVTRYRYNSFSSMFSPHWLTHNSDFSLS